ncbi:MAG: 1-acyl-sn-glycerol-3-phosphate acyltransferase, partial [Colwellia sp.]|nr:1-acyl-sn-glycerol-3-phosphate acyltransferase [Colwellia sp.]
MPQVNYYWRLLATGLCFFSFGIGALFISSIIFPLQTLLIKDKAKRKEIARYTIHKAFALFVNMMKFSGVLAVKLENFEQLNNMREKIVIANHPSLIDVIVIIAYLPNADCVVKSDLFKNPFLRGVVRRVGYIDNNNSEQLFNDCKQSLAAGCNIVVF